MRESICSDILRGCLFPVRILARYNRKKTTEKIREEMTL